MQDLRRIPQIDRALSSPALEPILEKYSRPVVTRSLRQLLDEMRRLAVAGALSGDAFELPAIATRLDAFLHQQSQPFYCRVVNATGVILHTGLGRAPLPVEAATAVGELAAHPQRVEIDLESGDRGGRDQGCDLLIRELTGCEAATVVNNNAAATLVILAALARGTGVLLSRGEMVEIGGSYRIPSIMEESGASLVDVGTTNRTHERDYRDAITADTGMILKVHTSNYRVVGFTKEVEIPALVEIGREHDLPVVHDLGSGGMIDLARHGRPGEAMVRESIAAGADLVCFSGDKLLGGPQAGIIAGRREAVEKCKRHPLFRSIRPGRLVYTALEATLRIYLEGEDEAVRRIPALGRLLAPVDEVRSRAEALAERLQEESEIVAAMAIEACESRAQAGSGSLPARDIPSWGLRVTPQNLSAASLAAQLRQGTPAVLTRVHDDALVFDLRTLDTDDVEIVERRLLEISRANTTPRGTSDS